MRIISIFLKRLFDIFVSLIAIIILVPVWIFFSIAIKLDSKGPVFFKQEIRTKNGKIFKMIKFRSMVVDAEKMGTGLFNYKNDSRVTKVGRFLRNTSMDELPQFFNVFIGQMSLIGPRPCVKYELGDYETLNARFKKRFLVKAGITGWAQVKGRNDIDWCEKVDFDNEYIDKFAKYGILIDIVIFFKSIGKVFKKEDIYEKKISEDVDDIVSSKLEEERIIKLAHLPDQKIGENCNEI